MLPKKQRLVSLQGKLQLNQLLERVAKVVKMISLWLMFHNWKCPKWLLLNPKWVINTSEKELWMRLLPSSCLQHLRKKKNQKKKKIPICWIKLHLKQKFLLALQRWKAVNLTLRVKRKLHQSQVKLKSKSLLKKKWYLRLSSWWMTIWKRLRWKCLRTLLAMKLCTQT